MQQSTNQHVVAAENSENYKSTSDKMTELNQTHKS